MLCSFPNHYLCYDHTSLRGRPCIFHHPIVRWGGGGGASPTYAFQSKIQKRGILPFFFVRFFLGGKGFNFKGVYARENDEKMDDPLRNRMNTKQYANLNQIHMAKSVSISGRTHFTSFSRIGLLKTTNTVLLQLFISKLRAMKRPHGVNNTLIFGVTGHAKENILVPA